MNTAPVTEATPRVVDVEVTDDALTMRLEDGRSITVPIGYYPRLALGSPDERQNFRISGAAAGAHWPDLDEDISAEGLLAGRRSSEHPASFARWLDRRGQLAGVSP